MTFNSEKPSSEKNNRSEIVSKDNRSEIDSWDNFYLLMWKSYSLTAPTLSS